MSRTFWLFALAVVVSLFPVYLQSTGAASGGVQARLRVPGLAADSSPPASRAYRMGWFLVSPRPTVNSVLETFPLAAQHSDAVLLQREVPWTRILAGTPMETIAQEDYDELIRYLTGIGLHVSILVDPLDGLDRTREGNEMRAAGRSLNEPEMRALHEQWVELLAKRYHFEYFGLASEINSLAARGDPVLFGNLRDMSNRLAPKIRADSPGTKVFVSFQVDEAWGRPPIPPSSIDQFALSRTFDIDVLGLSSYPSFFFNDPAEIPDDYFRRLEVASGKPVLMAEGGWSSAGQSGDESPASLAKQTEFYQRFFALMDTVQPELVVLLLFADLDLPAWQATAPPGTNVDGLRPFGQMGVLHSNFQPKPALSVWDARFKLPYRR